MKIMIRDMRPDQMVTTQFYLSSNILCKSRRDCNRNYLQLSLRDRTGSINGYLWTDPEIWSECLKEGSFVEAKFRVKQGKRIMFLNINQIREADEMEVDLADYYDRTRNNSRFNLQNLEIIVSMIKDKYLKMLILSFLSDPVFIKSFLRAPAGQKIHHNYVGGLIEHTLNVMTAAVFLSEQYPRLSRDLLLAGAFFHDLGKVKELGWKMGPYYTDEGRFLGHIIIGIQMIEEKVRLIPDFPDNHKEMLIHMMISHHGRSDYGSPVHPVTPEALALHHIDNMDARLNHMECHIRNGNPKADWSTFDKINGSTIYQRPFLAVTEKIPQPVRMLPSKVDDQTKEIWIFSGDELILLDLDDDKERRLEGKGHESYI